VSAKIHQTFADSKDRGKNNFGSFMVAITLDVMIRKKNSEVNFPAILTVGSEIPVFTVGGRTGCAKATSGDHSSRLCHSDLRRHIIVAT
jgi:hypothetical protein